MADVAQPDARTRLGRIGIWSLELRFGDPGQAVDAVAELDELGYGAVWIPGGVGGDLFGDVGRLLGASRRLTVATGILNIWKHSPDEVGAWWHAQSAADRARVMFGLGVSHGPLIGEAYAKPLTAMRGYLDGLAEQDVPADHLCLAALGPKMLELARDRTAGVHPYLITPEHTASARAVLGPDALLAPEQGVILESDPAKARALAHAALESYRHLPNYVNSWKRLGFSEAEIEALDPRLVDALFAWGGVDAIVARVDAHLAAGASHVCLQVIAPRGTPADAIRPIWRTLAAALL